MVFDEPTQKEQSLLNDGHVAECSALVPEFQLHEAFSLAGRESAGT
jgi:hypothetical protein